MARQTAFFQDFRRFFLRGLAVLLPAILTIVILVKAWEFVDTTISGPINAGLRSAWATAIRQEPPDRDVIRFVQQASGEPAPANPTELYERYVYYRYYRPYLLDVVGILLAVIAVYFIGYVLATFVGRNLWKQVERSFRRLPVFRTVYPYVKEITDFVFGEKKMSFKRVVAVEYPRRGMWSIALVTGSGLRSLNQKLGEDMLTLFLPSSPTPFTGYVVIVPRKDVVDLSISVDAVLRLVVSGGVVIPPAEANMKELGPEAVYRLEIRNFPLVVGIDSTGKDIYG